MAIETPVRSRSSVCITQPALERLEVGDRVRDVVARPRMTPAVDPDRVQAGPARASHVELDVVAEVDDLFRRATELPARQMEERTIGFARAMRVRRNHRVEQVIEPDLHETCIAVGK